MTTRPTQLAIMLALALAWAVSASADVRIRDIARARGARHNQLVGYGLVVGLEGTGDSSQMAVTGQAVRNLVLRLGNRPDDSAGMKTKNAAAVIITADLAPFINPGDTIDVTVSSLGDAASLQGGILLQTPLQGANGEVYAVAQGPVSIGGFAAGGGGAQVTRNHPTVGRIPNGALVEAAVPSDILTGDTLALCLRQPDYATAVAVANAIINALPDSEAIALDASTVSTRLPESFSGRSTEFLAAVGYLTVPVDAPARVVINERTGTVVVGGPVTISSVAVAHGNLTVEVQTMAAVSQPPPLSSGETVVVTESAVTVTEEGGPLVPLSAATVDDLVRALNALRASPRDLTVILQAIKQAGALHATLEII